MRDPRGAGNGQRSGVSTWLGWLRQGGRSSRRMREFLRQPKPRSESVSVEMRVRIASVVADPASGVAVVALVPADDCRARLADRPPPAWGTLAVRARHSDVAAARLATLAGTGSVVTLGRTVEGICVLDRGDQLPLRLFEPPYA